MATTCANGRTRLNAKQQRFLWARSAGHCCNPTCRSPLFVALETGQETFGELAHILPATEGGPRDDEDIEEFERSATDNIVLLCANCHTIVDKAPEEFPVERLRNWQHSHMQMLEDLFGVVQADTRERCRELVEPILRQNRSVFETYGPLAQQENGNTGGEYVRLWVRKVRETILPNNRRLLAVSDCNRRLLTEVEAAVVESLRQHVDDLEARHFRGEVEIGTTRFPEGAEGLFS